MYDKLFLNVSFQTMNANLYIYTFWPIKTAYFRFYHIGHYLEFVSALRNASYNGPVLLFFYKSVYLVNILSKLLYIMMSSKLNSMIMLLLCIGRKLNLTDK